MKARISLEASPPTNPHPEQLARSKRLLDRRGWTYRSAAEVLGVTYQHVSDVLNGQRQSRRLLKAISALPVRVGNGTSTTKRTVRSAKPKGVGV